MDGWPSMEDIHTSSQTGVGGGSSSRRNRQRHRQVGSSSRRSRRSHGHGESSDRAVPSPATILLQRRLSGNDRALNIRRADELASRGIDVTNLGRVSASGDNTVFVRLQRPGRPPLELFTASPGSQVPVEVAGSSLFLSTAVPDNTAGGEHEDTAATSVTSLANAMAADQRLADVFAGHTATAGASVTDAAGYQPSNNAAQLSDGVSTLHSGSSMRSASPPAMAVATTPRVTFGAVSSVMFDHDAVPTVPEVEHLRPLYRESPMPGGSGGMLPAVAATAGSWQLPPESDPHHHIPNTPQASGRYTADQSSDDERASRLSTPAAPRAATAAAARAAHVGFLDGRPDPSTPGGDSEPGTARSFGNGLVSPVTTPGSQRAGGYGGPALWSAESDTATRLTHHGSDGSMHSWCIQAGADGDSMGDTMPAGLQRSQREDGDCSSGKRGVNKGDQHQGGGDKDMLEFGVNSLDDDVDSHTCAICMDRLVGIRVSSCSHTMCLLCAFQLCSKGRSAPLCPFCRQPISGFDAQLMLD